ncbi:hypothetical protein TSMEX_008316 [Taenia solium]|eukprot:TsM_001112100 transcript=TsM_001112100 gene=TsM_001112100
MSENFSRHKEGVKLQLMGAYSCLQEASDPTEWYQPSTTDSCGLVCSSISDDPGCGDSAPGSQ